MKQNLAFTCALVLVAVLAHAQSKDDPEKKTEPAQRLATAEILKIDAKKKSLQVREVAEARTTPNRGQGGQNPRPRNGGGGAGGGGGRRRGGGGGGGGGRRFPGGGYPGQGAPQAAKEYKVFVTKDTALKLFGT